MKRKRASKNSHKKGKKKTRTVAGDPASSPSNTDGDEKDVSPTTSKNEIELPPFSPDKTSMPDIQDPTPATGASSRQPGYGRVKVKLKSSRTLEPSKTSIEKATSDVSIEKKEGSNVSDGKISDLQPTSSDKSPRKAGSIKIISSRGMRPLNVGVSDEHDQASSPLQTKEEIERTAESSVHKKYRRRDAPALRVDPRYNENELKSALVVIKKIMRMEAAEPFNAPVDPVALGIPDYFEVIETPMDFGTICEDLDRGAKYLNSKDVFKDVQYIWENCYKYNNKGDYIMDLVKRVKRNFMKYWTAAGLSTDLSGDPEDGAQAETSGKHKESKGKSSKSKRKRFGIDLHKSGCLCAVCVVRRRRREREGLSEATERQLETSDFKDEVQKSSPRGNSPSDRTSSSLEQLQETNAAAGAEEAGEEGAFTSPQAKPVISDIADDESSRHPPDEVLSRVPESPVDLQDSAMRDELRAPADEQPQPPEEDEQGSALRGEELSVYEDPSRRENLAVLEICRTLFGRDSNSVWRGPHSLNQRQAFTRYNPIQTALSTFFSRQF